jgi:hypothetical protein
MAYRGLFMKTYVIGYRINKCVDDTDQSPWKRGTVIDSEPDIRFDKVRAIQEEIQRGDYIIDYDRIAENMLGVFTDEMSASPVFYPRFSLYDA